MKISKKIPEAGIAYIEQMKQLQEKLNIKKVNKVSSNRIREKVEISDRAQEIQRLKKLLEKIPAARKEKIAEIKEALQKGTYNVDNKKLAEKILEEGFLNILKG